MKSLSRLLVLLAAWSLCGGPADDSPHTAIRLWIEGITDISGLSALTPFSTLPYDDQDLGSICAVKRQVLTNALQATGDYLAHLQSLPERQRDRAEIMKLHHQLGQLAMYQGKVRDAIAELQEARNIAAQENLSTFRDSLEEKLAIAHLRLGEVENCLHHRNAKSCIFPISPEARHHLPAGSQAAINSFLSILKRDPSNLSIRWLLNIAFMTLGQYPGKVPHEYLVPASAFESPRTVGRFLDVAPQIGLDTDNSAGGTIVEDFDGDGLLDVLISSQNSCVPLRLWHNNGDNTFSDQTEAAKLLDQLGGLNLVSTDYNNDGRPDIFVLRGGWEFKMRNSLLRNNGDGTFSDVTREAGLAVPATASQTASWADFDGDGFLDVFVGNEFSPSQLFRNRGDGTFEDVAKKAGVGRTAFTKGAAWGDYDNDGYPDLYVSNFGEPNYLYHNNRDGTFQDVAIPLGVHKPLYSFPVWFMDYDNDGWEDLFVSGYVQSLSDVTRGYLRQDLQGETFKVYKNDKGAFIDVTERVGLLRNALTMGCNFGDFDNDGFLDFYLGTGAPSYGALVPNLLFWNDHGRAFFDVTSSAGVGHLQKGHGLAFADLDNDGDQDIFLHSGGAVPGDSYANSLFANPGNQNRWIDIRLIGHRSNRAAIGARLKVVLPDGRQIHRVVNGGTSFGASSFQQHIGLGQAERVQTLQIYWPASRSTQVFHNLKPGQAILVDESAATYRTVRRRRFDLLAANRGRAH